MKVFKDSKELTPQEIAAHANKVHRAIGGRGYPYTSLMFTPSSDLYRLDGCHCNCGVVHDTLLNKDISLGEFDLLPETSEEVQDGEKAYMICRKCGCYSHL